MKLHCLLLCFFFIFVHKFIAALLCLGSCWLRSRGALIHEEKLSTGWKLTVVFSWASNASWDEWDDTATVWYRELEQLRAVEICLNLPDDSWLSGCCNLSPIWHIRLDGVGEAQKTVWQLHQKFVSGSYATARSWLMKTISDNLTRAWAAKMRSFNFSPIRSKQHNQLKSEQNTQRWNEEKSSQKKTQQK